MNNRMIIMIAMVAVVMMMGLAIATTVTKTDVAASTVAPGATNVLALQFNLTSADLLVDADGANTAGVGTATVAAGDTTIDIAPGDKIEADSLTNPTSVRYVSDYAARSAVSAVGDDGDIGMAVETLTTAADMKVSGAGGSFDATEGVYISANAVLETSDTVILGDSLFDGTNVKLSGGNVTYETGETVVAGSADGIVNAGDIRVTAYTGNGGVTWNANTKSGTVTASGAHGLVVENIVKFTTLASDTDAAYVVAVQVAGNTFEFDGTAAQILGAGAKLTNLTPSVSGTTCTATADANAITAHTASAIATTSNPADAGFVVGDVVTVSAAGIDKYYVVTVVTDNAAGPITVIGPTASATNANSAIVKQTLAAETESAYTLSSGAAGDKAVRSTVAAGDGDYNIAVASTLTDAMITGANGALDAAEGVIVSTDAVFDAGDTVVLSPTLTALTNGKITIVGTANGERDAGENVYVAADAAVANAHTRVNAIPEIYVLGSAGATNAVAGDATWRMEDANYNVGDDIFILNDGGAPDTVYGDKLDAATVKNAGSLPAGDFDVVRIHEDTNGDQVYLDAATDSQLAIGSWNSGTGLWELDLATNNAFATAKEYFIIVSVSASATDGQTIQMQIPASVDVNANGIFNASDKGLYVESTDDTGSLINANLITVSAGNSENDGSIAVSTTEQVIVAGKGNQALALITITDIGTSHVLGGTTKLTAPAGVTFNTSASDFGNGLTVTATGNLDVVGAESTLTSTLLTVTHSTTSDQGDAIRISGLVIDTTADITATADGVTDLLGTLENIKINHALGSFSATKLLKVYKPDIEQAESPISAGGTGESLSSLIVTTNGAAGQIGNNTNIMIYAPTSKGIMFDLSQDPATWTVTDASDVVNETTAGVTIAEGSITLPVIADWGAGDTINITGIKVNTTAAAENGTLTVAVTAASPSTGVVQADVVAVGNIHIQKPTFTFDAGSTVIVGGLGQVMAHNLTIESTTMGDLTMSDDLYGRGWINLTANMTDVTFDTRMDGDIDCARDGFVNLDDADVIVSDDGCTLSLHLNLSAGASAANNITLNATELKVNVSDTVADGAVFRFDITTTPSAGLEIEGATDSVVTAEKPTIGAIAASTDIAIGASGSALTGTLVITSVIAGDLTTGNDLAGATGWINLTLNNTAVTFNKSMNDAGIWDANPIAVTPVGYGILNDTNVTVTDDKLAIKLTLNATESAAIGDEVTIDLTKVQLNVTADANLDDANVLFHVNTTPETGSNVINDSTVAAKLVLPTLAFTESTIVVDADYINGTTINSVTVTAAAKDAADICPSNPTWVNLTITGGSGVKFDKSDGVGIIAVTGAAKDDDSFEITDTKIAIQLTAATADGDLVTFSPHVNATAGATNTTLSVETNPGSVSITQALDDQIIVTDIVLTGVTGNANTTDDTDPPVAGDHGATGAAETLANVVVGTTTQGSVYVLPSGVSAGNVDVTLAIVEAPAGATGYALDESSITTGPDDIAYFNFTSGDLVGTYIVNATLPGVAGGVNMTYTATAGAVNGVSVTPIENAIAGLSGDAGNATLWVNLTDIYGNPVGAGAATTLELDGDGYITVDAYDTLTVDGEGTGTVTTELVESTLTIADDGSSVIELTNTVAESVDVTVEYDSHSDTGTVIFYGPITNVTLELNDSEVIIGENVTANATIKQSDGTAIKVPDVAMVFDDNTDANTSFVAPSAHVTTITVNTNEDGVASATVRADSDGTSTLDASTSMRRGSAVLTIDQPTLSLSLNATYVAVGVETPVLATVVFQHNGTKAEGVTINVTGAGVTVAEQDTDANGNATCTVNATSAGTITVNATKTGCVLGTATVTAGAAPTIDTITIAPTGPLTMNTTETQTFTATCYNDSTEVTGITVTWASSNETVGTIDASGVLTAAANGTITINATAQGVTSNAVTVTVGAATGLVGDINGDSKVDLDDLILFGVAWGASTGEPEYNALADINGDGVIGLDDLILLGANWTG